jgi:sulfite reductase alpha subunit-like flavoprotein
MTSEEEKRRALQHAVAEEAERVSTMSVEDAFDFIINAIKKERELLNIIHRHLTGGPSDNAQSLYPD